MNALSSVMSSWFDAVLMMSLQGGVMVVLILFLQKIFWHRLTAGWRHAFWLLLFICLLFPMRFSSSLSPFHLSDRAFEKIRGKDSGALAKRLQSRIGYDLLVVNENSYTSHPVTVPSVGPGHTAPVQVVSSPSLKLDVVENVIERPFQILPKQAWKFEMILAWGWCVGSVMFFLIWIASELRFRFRIRRCSVMEDNHTLEMLKCVQREMGICTSVTLVECSWCQGPAVVGWLHKTLLLPADFAETFDDDSKRHIFLHELAHIRRCDLETSAVMNFLLCLHWFNPLMWLAAWRMKTDRELAADAQALHYIGKDRQESYGETLILLLSRFHGRNKVGGTLGMAESKTQLTQRMRAIANYRISNSSHCMGFACFLTLTALVLSDASEQDVTPVPNVAERVYVMTQSPMEASVFDRAALTANPDGPPHPIQTIRLKVVNDQTDEPVPLFKVYGWETAQLRPLFTLEGFKGELEIPKTAWEEGENTSKPADSIMLNIESDGFFASHSEPLLGRRRNEGVLEYEFRMVSRGTITIKVLTSKGKPVPDVKVNFLDGKLMRQSYGKSGPHRKKAHYVGITDLDGAFEITPSNADIFSKQIVVACSEGIYIGFLKNQPEFNIELQPWGRLEGVVRLAGTPVAGLSVNQHAVYSKWVKSSGISNWWLYDQLQTITTTDSEGRFVFKKVIPGKIKLYVGSLNDGIEDVNHDYEVAPGTTQVEEFDLERARQVLGSVRLPASAPTYDSGKGEMAGQLFPRIDGKEPALEELKSSVYFGRFGYYGTAAIGAIGLRVHWSEGSKFQIHDVPPGDYHMLLSVRSSAHGFNASWDDYLCSITVPGPQAHNDLMTPLDLGRVDFEFIGPEPLREGNGPELNLNAFDSEGADFGVKHYHGRYLLLHFWQSGDDENRGWQLELGNVNRRKSESVSTSLFNGILEKRHRFEIITIGVDQDAMRLRNFIQETPFEWKHGFMDNQASNEMLQQLKADSLPKAILVDPSGKVILSSSSVSDAIMILNEELDKMRQMRNLPTF